MLQLSRGKLDVLILDLNLSGFSFISPISLSKATLLNMLFYQTWRHKMILNLVLTFSLVPNNVR